MVDLAVVTQQAIDFGVQVLLPLFWVVAAFVGAFIITLRMIIFLVDLL